MINKGFKLTANYKMINIKIKKVEWSDKSKQKGIFNTNKIVKEILKTNLPLLNF